MGQEDLKTIKKRSNVLLFFGILLCVAIIALVVGGASAAIVYMLKQNQSSTENMINEVISQISESNQGIDDSTAIIAGLTMMENQFNNTLSHLSMILTAFFTITSFIAIGIPFYEKNKLDDLYDEIEEQYTQKIKELEDQRKTNQEELQEKVSELEAQTKNIQEKLKKQVSELEAQTKNIQENIKKQQLNTVMLMYSLQNICETGTYDSDQPSIATFSGYAENDSNSSIAKFIQGIEAYKRAHSYTYEWRSLKPSEIDKNEIIKCKQLLNQSIQYFKKATEATDNVLLQGLFYYRTSLSYHEIFCMPENTVTSNEKPSAIEQSIKYIQKALNLDKENPAYYSFLANIQREIDKNEQALENIKKAIEFRSKQVQIPSSSNGSIIIKDYSLAEYYMWRGVIEHEMGNFEEAIASKQRAIDYGYDRNEMEASKMVSEFMTRPPDHCAKEMSFLISSMENLYNENSGKFKDTGSPECLYWAKSYLGLMILKSFLLKGENSGYNIKQAKEYLDEAINKQPGYRNYLRRAQFYIILLESKSEHIRLSEKDREDYIKKGRIDLNTSCDYNPEYPDTMYAYYRYYSAIKDSENAKIYFEKAKALNYNERTHKPEPFGEKFLCE